MSETIRQEIDREITANKILVYGKGTKTMPRCGFTLETIQFFERFGYPFEVLDVLENMEKREALSEMTNWPTLPKVFINGKFYGDTDILGPMEQSGELIGVLKETFGAEPMTTINCTSPMLKLWDSGNEQGWLDSFVVRVPLRTWYSEIDSYGHVSNIVYPRYFEMGRMQYFKHIGDPEPADGIFPFAHVIAEQHIRYIERCLYDEELAALTKLTELGRSSATLEQAIVGKDRTMRAIAMTVIVHNDAKESKPWTPAQREAIAKFEGFQSSSAEF